MPKALTIFAAFIVIASGYAAIFPSELLSFVREVIAGPGLWWAAAARLVLAVMLWFSAPVSRTPITFKVLAVLALMGAAFAIIIGPEGMAEDIDWVASWPLWGVRLQSTFGVAFGVFLLWSVSRKGAAA